MKKPQAETSENVKLHKNLKQKKCAEEQKSILHFNATSLSSYTCSEEAHFNNT